MNSCIKLHVCVSSDANTQIVFLYFATLRSLEFFQHAIVRRHFAHRKFTRKKKKTAASPWQLRSDFFSTSTDWNIVLLIKNHVDSACSCILSVQVLCIRIMGVWAMAKRAGRAEQVETFLANDRRERIDGSLERKSKQRMRKKSNSPIDRPLLFVFPDEIFCWLSRASRRWATDENTRKRIYIKCRIVRRENNQDKEYWKTNLLVTALKFIVNFYFSSLSILFLYKFNLTLVFYSFWTICPFSTFLHSNPVEFLAERRERFIFESILFSNSVTVGLICLCLRSLDPLDNELF